MISVIIIKQFPGTEFTDVNKSIISWLNKAVRVNIKYLGQ